MSRPRIRRRWKSKFARFVLDFGTTALSEEIDVHPSAIYHWVRGATTPRQAHAAIIQRLAGERGVRLTLDEIYGHSWKIRSVSDIGEHRAKIAAADRATSRKVVPWPPFASDPNGHRPGAGRAGSSFAGGGYGG